MMNLPPAGHVPASRGQHCCDPVPPHVDSVQSWTAPKLWPVSCETTCHSVGEYVETAVPETTPELPWFRDCEERRPQIVFSGSSDHKERESEKEDVRSASKAVPARQPLPPGP